MVCMRACMYTSVPVLLLLMCHVAVCADQDMTAPHIARTAHAHDQAVHTDLQLLFDH